MINMAYNFNFDISKISQSFFADIAKFSGRSKIHEKMGSTAKYLIKKFNVEKMTGLPVSDSVTLIEDLIDTQIKNISQREAFEKTSNRALFLPHCSRKYMDSRCKARFIPEMSSYVCRHCSPRSCAISKATKIAGKKGYDVYVVPGGSGIKNILQKKSYDGIVGVACTEEMKLGAKLLSHVGVAGQAVPLIKNGCSSTKFSLDTLNRTL